MNLMLGENPSVPNAFCVPSGRSGKLVVCSTTTINVGVGGGGWLYV